MHANYASNNRKRDNVKIIRIVLDLHDVIVDSKKVVLFCRSGEPNKPERET